VAAQANREKQDIWGKPVMENENAVKDGTKSTPQAALAERRKRRIDELLNESLNNPDALQANLLAGATSYMRMAARLENLIGEAMDDSCTSLSDVRKLAGALDLHLKITRQYDRLVGLATRQQRGEKRDM
jgi:hypothetical protein